jgi:hypothetical protein
VKGRLLAAGCVLVLVTLAGGRTPVVAQEASAGMMRVELDKTSVEIGTGLSFQFQSTITNQSDQPLTAVIAHLNIVSVDGDVYVDPEDWSGDRSQYVDTLAPGGTTTLTWNVRAVTTGELILYVAATTSEAQTDVVASPPLHATVTATRTINASGVLPIALGVPAVLVVGLGFAVRRRRQLA